MNNTNRSTSFTKPELSTTFSENTDTNRISTLLLERMGAQLGKFESYRLNRDEITEDLTPEGFLLKEPGSKRIYPSHSFLQAVSSTGYNLVIGASENRDGSWIPYIEIRDSALSEADTVQGRLASLKLLLKTAREWSEHPQVTRVTVRRTLGLDWSPLAPGSADDEYLRLIHNPRDIQASYRDATAYLQAWDTRESIGDRLLLSRATNIVDSLEFAREVYPRQWELARRAYPGECKYYATSFSGLPDLREKELALFYEGEKCLSWVGYNPKQQRARASGYAEEGIHIPAHEIQDLYKVIAYKKMPDGSPVQVVEIIFPSREMALREGVPLLDIGAEVLYLTPQMTEEKLTTEDYPLKTEIQ